MVHVMFGPGSGLEDVPLRGSYYAAAWYASGVGQGTLELIAQRRMPHESALYKRGKITSSPSSGWDYLAIEASPMDIIFAPRLWHHLPAEMEYVQKTNRHFIVRGNKRTGLQLVFAWDAHLSTPGVVNIPEGYAHVYFSHGMRSELDELVLFGGTPKTTTLRRIIGKQGSIEVLGEDEVRAVLHKNRQPPLSLVFTTKEADAAYRQSNPGKAQNIMLEFTP